MFRKYVEFDRPITNLCLWGKKVFVETDIPLSPDEKKAIRKVFRLEVVFQEPVVKVDNFPQIFGIEI